MARKKGKGSELDEALLQSMGPGARLRMAREAKKITLESVSETLRLSKQRIIAMENDDHSDMPALIYARGRLRQYANFLGVSQHEIIKAFDQLSINEPAKAPSNSSLRPVRALPHTGSDSVVMTNMRWWTFGLGLVLLVFIIIGWREYAKQNQAVPLANAAMDVGPNQNATATPLVIPGVNSKSPASITDNHVKALTSPAATVTTPVIKGSPAANASSTTTSVLPLTQAATNKDKMPQYESKRPE